MSDDPQDTPAPGKMPHHGVPPDASEGESKGLPHSDREASETAVGRVSEKDR